MNALQQEIAQLIVDTLNLEDVDPTQIPVNQPLFGEGLGLDSVDALELALALQKRYDDLDIGSYPAFRNGKPSVSLVLRGTDDARLSAAAVELLATIRGMNGEAEEFAQ